MWQYEASNGTWKVFAEEEGAAVESRFQQYRSSCEEKGACVARCCFNGAARMFIRMGESKQMYIINFQKMRRRNFLSQHQRNIRRFELKSVQSDYEATTMQVESILESFDTASMDEVRCAISNIPRTPRTPLRVRKMSSFMDSVVSNDGSIAQDRTPAESRCRSRSQETGSQEFTPCTEPSLRKYSVFSNAIQEFEGNMDDEKAKIHDVQESIDGMWLKELNSQVSAELLHVTVDSANKTESGIDFMEVNRQAQLRFEKIRSTALKSLAGRFANRSSVTIDGGFEYLDSAVRENFSKWLVIAADLVVHLIESDKADHVRVCAQKHLELVVQDLESVNEAKENSTLTMFDLDEHVHEIHQTEYNFIASFLNVALQNPENVSLQLRTIHSLSKTLRIWARDGRSEGCCSEAQGMCWNFSSFVLGTMSTYGQVHPHVLIDGCSAVVSYSIYNGLQNTALVQAAADIVALAMRMDSVSTAKPNVQYCAIHALLTLAEHSTESKVAVANSEVLEGVQRCIEDHPTHAKIQNQGMKLLGTLVWAATVKKQLAKMQTISPVVF
jgi:hypothetical protein